MISFDSSITLPLRPVIEDDYLHISIVIGPGHLENKSVIILPSWVDLEFSYEGHITMIHDGGRTMLTVPPGPPIWQLKMTRSVSAIIKQQSACVTIGYDQQEFL